MANDNEDRQAVYPGESIWSLSTDQDYKNLVSSLNYKREQLEAIVTDQANRSSGKGGFYSQFQNNLTKIDRFGHRIMNSTTELSGLTFITRPKLNMSTVMLKQDPNLILLNSVDPNSVSFMIRMLLDTKLSNAAVYAERVQQSLLFDQRNPFLTPLMNNLTDISGFPDPTMDVYTSEGGFFNEDISFVAGSDDNKKTFELTINFNDIQYGIVMNILGFWYKWMSCMSKGITQPYLEDMINRTLNYTVAIYRFILDPSRHYITRWAKCTGCFPRAYPIGGVFNISSGEVFTNSAAKFSVPFTCNVFEDNKVTSLLDFNILMKKFFPDINNAQKVLEFPNIPEFNFIGYPYIKDTKNGLRLVWRGYKSDNTNYSFENLESHVLDMEKESNSLIDMEQEYERETDNAAESITEIPTIFTESNPYGIYV